MDQPATSPTNISLILAAILLAGMLGGLVVSPPPDVNEAHYLTKAKRFWDDSFCQSDLFVSSYETHWLYYATHGWFCRFLSFQNVAWIGRVVAWLTTAIALILLNRVFWPRLSVILVLACLATVLNMHFNLAGEWFVGGTEAKSLAWPFVLISIACWLRHEINWMLVFLGMACAFHIVIGLWALIAGLIGSFIGRRWLPAPPDEQPASSQIRWRTVPVFAALTLFGLVPALLQNAGTSQEIVVQASEIQAYGRLAHHQWALDFEPIRWITFGALTLTWLILVVATWNQRSFIQHRLNQITCGALILDLIGIVLAIMPELFPESQALAARLLTLYWFRLADVLVPIAVVINGKLLLQQLGQHQFSRLAPMIAASAVVLAAIGINTASMTNDPRSGSARQANPLPKEASLKRRTLEADRNWIRTCEWIRDNTPVDAVFITPSGQQTFKWYSHRGEVASWKDMPQDARSVLEWDRRMNELYRSIPQQEFGMLGHLNSELLEMAGKYDAGYLIVEQRFVDRRDAMEYPVSFARVWPGPGEQATFVVFRFR